MTTETLTRHAGLVTSLSWIPTEAIEGAQRLAFDSGITHYDPPPPTEGMDVEKLRDEDRFRFANELRAYITVDGAGRIVDCGYEGGGLMGSTMVNLGAVKHRFQAVQLPDIQRPPERGDGWVRFVQTCGGRTGVPAPRRVRRRPFMQWQAPSRVDHALADAARGRANRARADRRQPVPASLGLRRREPALAQVGPDRLQGLVPQVVRQAQPVGRRGLRGVGRPPSSPPSRPRSRHSSCRVAASGASSAIPAGTVLFKEGEPGTEVLLILDGIVRVERGGERLAEYGPGALLGERAHLEGGIRTSSNIAVTPCRVAMFEADLIDRSHLEELSVGHRREDHARD